MRGSLMHEYAALADGPEGAATRTTESTQSQVLKQDDNNLMLSGGKSPHS